MKLRYILFGYVQQKLWIQVNNFEKVYFVQLIVSKSLTNMYFKEVEGIFNLVTFLKMNQITVYTFYFTQIEKLRVSDLVRFFEDGPKSKISSEITPSLLKKFLEQCFTIFLCIDKVKKYKSLSRFNSYTAVFVMQNSKLLISVVEKKRLS